jgi:FKBP-type peptidyl-prolyl cis-trans isomerase FkpA
LKKLLIVLSALGLIGLWGCSSDSESESVAEEADTSATAATAAAPRRVPDEGVPVISKPSGVRYQDLIRGDGKEVVDSMLVKYEYRVWFADREGLTKERSFHSSIASEQPYFGQVGVTLIEGLSDGLIGMRAGGMRRIYIPSELGYG